MSGIYVTPNGLIKKTLAELKTSFEANYAAAFGTSIDLDPSGPWGQHIGIISKAFADLWDLAAEIHSSRDPATATGIALDSICAETGVTRIPSAPSVADVFLTGTTGTVVPAGKKVKQPNSSQLWSTDVATTILASAAHAVLFDPVAPSNGLVYTITMNGTVAATHTANGASTKQSVVDALKAALIANLTYEQSIDTTGAKLGIGYSSGMVLMPWDTAFNVSATNMAVLSATAKCRAVCDATGPTPAPARSLSEIATPVSGWTGTTNIVAAAVGRNVETDDELRIRRRQTFLVGKSTEDAIRDALLREVPGISYATVISNRTMSYVGLQPPKSFEAVVVGGTATQSEIAQVIWDYMPAGIEPFGNIGPVLVHDATGAPQYVRYSTPTPIYLWIKATISLYDEEIFGGVQAVKDAIVAWASSEYGLDKDVIPKRICIPIYSIPGVSDIVIEVKTSSTSAGNSDPYGTAVIPIDERSIATVADNQITVVVV